MAADSASFGRIGTERLLTGTRRQLAVFGESCTTNNASTNWVGAEWNGNVEFLAFINGCIDISTHLISRFTEESSQTIM